MDERCLSSCTALGPQIAKNVGGDEDTFMLYVPPFSANTPAGKLVIVTDMV